jgi:hypothetical protein
LSSKPSMLIIAASLVPLPLPPPPSIAGSWAELPLSLPPIIAPVITPRNEHSMICSRVSMMISMGRPDQGGPTQENRTAARAGGRESKASCWAGFNARAIISQGKVHQRFGRVCWNAQMKARYNPKSTKRPASARTSWSSPNDAPKGSIH